MIELLRAQLPHARPAPRLTIGKCACWAAAETIRKQCNNFLLALAGSNAFGQFRRAASRASLHPD